MTTTTKDFRTFNRKTYYDVWLKNGEFHIAVNVKDAAHAKRIAVRVYNGMTIDEAYKEG